jgi:D-lactate dehydrogenase
VRIAFFGAKRYDREAFSAANGCFGHAITFLEPRLGPDTARYAEGHEAVCAFVNDALTREVIARLAELGVRVIALRCTGFNNVDLHAAREHDMPVVRVSSYSPHSVAEHAVALMLTLNRQTHKAYHRAREGNFSSDGLVGFDLHGRNAGIIGAGKIGRAVATVLAGFGCRLLIYDVAPDVLSLPPGAEVVPLDRLFDEADLITLHCPLTPATRHLIDAEAIAQMKPGVMLINTSRGGLLDTAAVIAALKSEQIGHLGLDVYEEEEGVFIEDLSLRGYDDDHLARLMTMPNVLVTSHQAFLTREALDTIAVTTLGNIACIERGEPCPNRVA